MKSMTTHLCDSVGSDWPAQATGTTPEESEKKIQKEHAKKPCSTPTESRDETTYRIVAL
jgi:hypothetical protein